MALNSSKAYWRGCRGRGKARQPRVCSLTRWKQQHGTEAPDPGRLPGCCVLGADVDEQSKNEIKDVLLAYDRTLLVADPRRSEPKK